MKVRSSIAVGLVCAMIVGLAGEARAADDADTDSASPSAPAATTAARAELPPPFERALPVGRAPIDVLLLSRPALLAPPANEVRLSHGAKTAIIVTAIVVGALLLVGFVAVGPPHDHLF